MNNHFFCILVVAFTFHIEFFLLFLIGSGCLSRESVFKKVTPNDLYVELLRNQGSSIRIHTAHTIRNI
jgi:hypothetical protein